MKAATEIVKNCQTKENSVEEILMIEDYNDVNDSRNDDEEGV